MAYGIALSIDTRCSKEIEKAMSNAGFVRLQENLYRSDKDDIDAVFDAIEELNKVKQGFTE